jgi:uncharacterized protein YecT (DUF1311 family)
MKTYLTILFALSVGICVGQGDLKYLKDNFYLEQYYLSPFNCDSLTQDGLFSIQDRICANLKLQEADLILETYYDSVRTEILSFKNDSLIQSFESLQLSWREYRNSHCETLYGGYETTTGAVIYMNEMRRLTEVRIEEMKALLKIYNEF